MRRLLHVIIPVIGILLFVKLIFLFGSALLYKESALAPIFEPSKETLATLPQDKITIIRLPLASTTVSVEYDLKGKFVSEWAESGEEVVINGGYFHEDHSPSGYLVTDGERVGKRLFDENRSGLVTVQNGIFSIRDLQKEPFDAAQGKPFDYALQSYPFLIKDGVGAVKEDSGLLARRTAVGIDTDKNVYILVVSGRQVSLYEFMQELLDTKIPFTYVLNLDGGPSTGVYAQWGENLFTVDSFTPVPSVVRFKKK